MNASTTMLNQLRNRREGYSLPRGFYTDPEFYQLDLDSIWYREWLFAGHDCELAKPGSFFTLQIGEYPVIVVRQADGAIRAFHNSCRHRGSRVCAAAKGNAAKLVCPYHSWTYELDGRLLYARDMPKEFDPSQHGLKPVHCASIGGYVWICLAREAPDLDIFRARVEPYLLPHRLRDAKVAVETTIVENGNWKLVWENNRECYHCAGNHPELCRTFSDSDAINGVGAADDDPLSREHWARCEAAGLPSKFLIAENGQYRMSRVPLLRNVVSYTMQGHAAVRRPLSDGVAEPKIGSLLLFHYPTTWNHVLGDHALSFRVVPLGPKQTQVTTKWLVHKDAVEGVDYTIEELTKVWNATNDQDRRIVEENQIGISSPAYEPGPYAPTHESGVIQFVDWYAEFMEKALTGSSTLRVVA